jgi:hypothetical protein
MKRKRTPAPDSLVPREVLQQAKETFEPEQRKPRGKCTVCGAECSPTSTEQLCWVCRRLKISAWQDGDQQSAAQE